jgi:peptide/nickel transport system substrate-binding protein
MMAYLRNNIGHPATNGFIPIGLPNYNNKRIRGYEYNPAKSLELLKDAGFPNGKGLQAITITTTADYLDLCEFIQHELKNIGININIEVVTGVANRELIANSKVACFRGSWVADYPEPENYFSLFYSKNFAPSGPNYTHYKKEQFDQLYLKSFTELQLQKRYRIYQQMDSIIMKDAVVVPLYYDEAIRFINKNVSGLGINPINQLVLKGVEK